MQLLISAIFPFSFVSLNEPIKLVETYMNHIKSIPPVCLMYTEHSSLYLIIVSMSHDN